jgi:simple sugar transport system permease protein
MVVVIGIVGVLTADRGLLSATGISTVASVASHVGIVAATVTLLLLAGEFDLSVGGVIGAVTMLLAMLLTLGMPFWIAAITMIGFGVLVGLAHAVLVVSLGFSSFIVTLASGYMLAGLGSLVYSFQWVRTASLNQSVEPSPLLTALTGDLFGVPAVTLWWLLFALGGAYVLAHTSFGNWTYATGGARHQARAAGVPAARVKSILFVATAVSASLLGVIYTAEIKAATPGTGMGAEFEAVVASALGGGLLAGGYGSAVGTLFGMVALAAVRQGLYFAEVPFQWYSGGLGILLLFIVAVNDLVRRRALALR